MSAPVPKWIGVVDGEGRIRLEAKALFHRYIERLRNSAIELVVRKRGRPKSQSQLGYLFGVIYPVAAEHFGYMEYEINALHDACIRRLRGLKPEPNPLELRVSLADMEHEAVSDYIRDVRHWLLVEHGVVTPDADKVEFESRK